MLLPLPKTDVLHHKLWTKNAESENILCRKKIFTKPNSTPECLLKILVDGSE
jgi:hypothetical protein